MDKLEKALEKARQQRQSGLQVQATPQGRIFTPSATVERAAPRIEPVQVDEAYLRNYPIIAHHKRSKTADLFRLLRTQVLHIMSQAGGRTLGITSPNYGDGKTTIALNLAISIALDVKQTALLVDLDLRKPNVTDYLGVDAPCGLSDYLLRDRPITDCFMRLSFERLAVLPAGAPVDHSSEALGSPKMAALARELEKRYADRLIIYDMPPVLEQDDPLVFMPHVDAVLMVVRDEVTPVQDIKRSMNILSGFNVIGTVLNHAKDRKAFPQEQAIE